MGNEEVWEVSQIDPNFNIIIAPLEAVNHARISRTEMKEFIKENKIEKQVYIPEDGELLKSL